MGKIEDPPYQKVPVALIFFRRNSVLQVLERIRSYAPDQLFLVADGGRTPIEHEQCLDIRRQVQSAIDWPCQVQDLYSDINLSCRGNIPRGITWVFSQVDRAIILEDDTIPNMSFFPFCETMLERYADDHRIMTISGTNFFPNGQFFNTNDYIFSGYAETWGYATWSRAWKYYDADLSLWPAEKAAGLLKSGWLPTRCAEHWERVFESVWNRTCTFDPYDIQWLFACLLQNALSVVPRCNLITNIGGGQTATHTKSSECKFLYRSTQDLPPPISHPDRVIRNVDYDQQYGKLVFYGPDPTLVQRVRSRLVNVLPPSLRMALCTIRTIIKRKSDA